MATDTELPEQLPGYRWVVVNTWFVCSTATSMVNFGLGLLLPSMSEDLGLSPSQQGLLGSAAFWAGSVLAIAVSWSLSRFGPKALGVATLSLSALFLLLQGWAASFAILLVGRLGFGLVGLARSPTQALLVMQWFRQREILFVNGLQSACWGVLVGGGMLLTPHILSGFSNDWSAVLFTFAAGFGVLTVIWTLMGRERVPRRQIKGTVSKVPGVSPRGLANRDLWLNALGVAGAGFTLSAFFTFLPTQMLNTYDISLKWSGAALGISTLLGGVAGATVSYLATAIGRPNTMLQALGAVMAGTYVGLALASSVPILILIAVVNGIAWGCWPVTSSLPYRLAGLRPRDVAVAVAVGSTMFSLGTVLGPVVTGLLQEATDNLKTSLLIVSFGPLLLTFSGTFLRVGRTERPSAKKAPA